MNKNSINEVAKTYQRLVESAPTEPSVSSTNPGPNPDFSSMDISYGQSLSGERPDRDNRSFDDIMREVPYANMRRLLERINLCYQNGNCTQEEIDNLMQQYYRWLLSTVPGYD